jgi:hypothetical protein
MTYKDPTQQLLKAYQGILEGQITYGVETITVGTRIPRKKTKYVYLYIDSANNYSTGDKVIYNMTMALQIVSIQDISEGDETVVNSILDQVLQKVGDPDIIIMADFICLTSQFGDSEYDTEMSESNYIITKKLRMTHFIEQK